MVASFPPADVWTQVVLEFHQRVQFQQQSTRASGRVPDAWCVLLYTYNGCVFGLPLFLTHALDGEGVYLSLGSF
eukprot:COSAG06_NODE_54428_length_294_cov_1.307692_1_plen_74_part_01